ncbi:MAG: hypothetical protein AAB706_00690 [Patescibacteria group bacterium]
MNLFRSREASLSAVDTKTQLTTLGSQTAPGPLLVPGEAKFLKSARVAGVSSNEAAAQGGWIIRLEGPGIERGVFNLAGGAFGTAVATGAHSRLSSVRVPINIAVRPGQEILVFAEATGADMGTYQVGVTLEFGSEAGPESVSLGEITVEGDITAVDTLTRLTAQGSVTAPSRLSPPDAKVLKRILYAVASDAAADGEVNYILRLGGDAIKGGEQTFILGAESFIDVATSGDGINNDMPVMMLDNLDLDITPNETLDISVEMAGVDVGTASAVVTAVFA